MDLEYFRVMLLVLRNNDTTQLNNYEKKNWSCDLKKKTMKVKNEDFFLRRTIERLAIFSLKKEITKLKIETRKGFYKQII